MNLAGRSIARSIAMSLEKSVVTSDNPLRINFRCHVCGDSKEDPHKKRGWFVELDGEMFYKCFNCDYSNHISEYLKEHHPARYTDYLMDQRKERYAFDSFKKDKKEKPKAVMPKRKIEKLEHCVNVKDLDDNHPIKKYIRDNRLIPKRFWKDIFFTSKWKSLANHIKPETYSYEYDENRIVVALRDSNGDIQSVQGRALSKDTNAKYITIKPHDKASKLYGCDRVDESKDVFCFEGAFDSMFVENGIAITGGTLDPDMIPYENRVWVLDNEPRAIDTVKRIEKLIEMGERVVIFDSCLFTGKDINRMIQNGASIKDINEYLREHIYSGNMARLKFNSWRKV
tara:strand:- start:62023 stop:63045 length:1023 start_codon:yes stop_codon:yes gene_type:complete